MTGRERAHARPFLMHLRDGRTFHGAQFPNGNVTVSHPGEPCGWFTVAMSIETLTEHSDPGDTMHGAEVHWPDTSTP